MSPEEMEYIMSEMNWNRPKEEELDDAWLYVFGEIKE